MLSKKGASPTLGVLSHTCQDAHPSDRYVAVHWIRDFTVLYSYDANVEHSYGVKNDQLV
jgi:hypothetical protein